MLFATEGMWKTYCPSFISDLCNKVHGTKWKELGKHNCSSCQFKQNNSSHFFKIAATTTSLAASSGGEVCKNKDHDSDRRN